MRVSEPLRSEARLSFLGLSDSLCPCVENEDLNSHLTRAIVEMQ